jgi:hypothetical protein
MLIILGSFKANNRKDALHRLMGQVGNVKIKDLK